jgi:hypothetical protein
MNLGVRSSTQAAQAGFSYCVPGCGEGPRKDIEPDLSGDPLAGFWFRLASNQHPKPETNLWRVA